MYFALLKMILRFSLQNLRVPEDMTDVLVDNHCVVEYDDLPYPGLILDVDDQMVEVRATHRIGVNRFFWPLHEDEQWYTKDETLLGKEPELVTGRHRQLPKSVWEAIKLKLDL